MRLKGLNSCEKCFRLLFLAKKIEVLMIGGFKVVLNTPLQPALLELRSTGEEKCSRKIGMEALWLCGGVV